MNLEDIYSKKAKNLEIINKLNLELQDMINKVTVNDFKQLSYKEAEKFFTEFKYKLPDKDKFEKIVEEIKLKEYPELNRPVYYPILNEFKNISSKTALKIDKLLNEYSNNNVIYFGSGIWMGIFGFTNTRTKVEQLANFLVENNYAEYVYEASCHCNTQCTVKHLSQKDKDMFFKYAKKIDYSKLSDEEICEIENKKEKYGYIYICCENDCDVEISTIDEWNKNVVISGFKLIKKPIAINI